MCLVEGSRLGVPVGLFASLLGGIWGIWRGQHVPRERELCECAARPLPLSGEGNMCLGNGSCVCVPHGPFPSLLGGIWGIWRGQHVPRERELCVCATRPLPLSGEGNMCLGNGSRVRVPRGPFPSLLSQD